MGMSKCDKCGEIVDDIDAGFSPGLHKMHHDCGGVWRVVETMEYECVECGWWVTMDNKQGPSCCPYCGARAAKGAISPQKG
jgi:hypothetical protein